MLTPEVENLTLWSESDFLPTDTQTLSLWNVDEEKQEVPASPNETAFSPGYLETRRGTGVESRPSYFATGFARSLAEDIVKPKLSNPNARIIHSSVEAARIPDKILGILRARGFNGHIGDERAVVIPPDPAVFGKKAVNVAPEDMRSFVGAIDLNSTGRGSIGTFTYRVTIALLNMNPGLSFRDPDFALKIEELDAGAIHALIVESQRSWALRAREGLRYVVPVGLPSLGKRK